METGKDNTAGGDTPGSRETPEARVETLFEAVRATPTPLPEGLHARLIADAEAALSMPPLPAPGRASQARPRAREGAPTRRQPLAAVSGLVAAAAAGLWIGFAAPDPLVGALPGVMAGLGVAAELSTEDADLEVILLAFDDFLEEG